MSVETERCSGGGSRALFWRVGGGGGVRSPVVLEAEPVGLTDGLDAGRWGEE